MSKSTSKYNFIENILKLSETCNQDEIRKEWVFILKTCDSSQASRCVCNHRVKYISHYINIINGNCINVGSKCKKRLALNEASSNNRIIRYIYENIGDYTYTKISDVLAHSNNSQEKILEYIRYQIKEYVYDSEKLSQIKSDIGEVLRMLEKEMATLEIYQQLYAYVVSIDSAMEHIIELEEQRKAQERYYKKLEAERIRRAECSLITIMDSIGKVSNVDEETDEPTTSKEIKLKCMCGIRYTCECSDPILELQSVNNEYWCNGCNRWACRC